MKKMDRTRRAMSVLGIMSGTSMDGVDYALCRVSQREVGLVVHWHRPFPKVLRARLSLAAQGKADSHEAARLHHDLGRFYTAHATAKDTDCQPDLIALHGQTIYHAPQGARSATLQIGEPAHLVEHLRVPVVSNFRAADLAAGGQGAPLAPLFHWIAFGEQGGHVCVNNLGGVSNVTSIDWRAGGEPSILAFDTGPANLPIDLAVRRLSHGKRAWDRHGRWAARGKVHEKCLHRWLKHDYFSKPPPKSTGRECFGESFLTRALKDLRQARANHFDMAATLTEFSARSLAIQYQRFLRVPLNRLILCGGGAANPSLVAAIKKALGEWQHELEITTAAEWGWPLQAIEPAAFALLAYYSWHRLPANIPSATGAARRVVLGQISYPS